MSTYLGEASVVKDEECERACQGDQGNRHSPAGSPYGAGEHDTPRHEEQDHGEKTSVIG